MLLGFTVNSTISGRWLYPSPSYVKNMLNFGPTPHDFTRCSDGIQELFGLYESKTMGK